MSKELEALNTIRKNLSNKTFRFNLVELLDIIEPALQRLEAIENAKPSEALECLEYLYCDPVGYTDSDRNKDYNIIKQALIKAEKEHNSINLLMQELDCKDFAELRKYARCGYEKMNKQFFNDLHLERVEE